MKFLQVSDLHLSSSSIENKKYGLEVLSEIIQAGEFNSCKAIFFCGDVFDTFPDLEVLRPDFVNLCQSFSGIVYFLPGNHEILRRNSDSTDYSKFDWSPKICLLDKIPYSFFEVENIEVIAIPHQSNYSELVLSPPPQKKTKYRIGLAHGTVTGMSFVGLEDEAEEGGSYLDPSLIRSLDIDYLAIGHLHSQRSAEINKCHVRYAGSSRVWRKNEFGARGGVILECLDSGIKSERILWKSAGEYRKLEVSLGLDGTPEEDIEFILDQFHQNDWVYIQFFGYVESMEFKRNLQNKIEEKYKTKFRILEFEKEESEIRVVENLTENSFINRFLEKMNELKPNMDESLWKQTKLNGIRLILEGKKIK